MDPPIYVMLQLKIKGYIPALQTLSCYENTTISISVNNLKSDETLKAEVANGKILKCSLGEFSGNTCPLYITP